MLRLGVIGLGTVAPYYLRAIASSSTCALVAVCDHDPAKAGAMPMPVFVDHRELLKQDGLDAVVVCVPNDAHEAVCADALDAARDVCCEKPLTLSSASASRLEARGRSSSTALFTAFHRRYNRHIRRLAAWLHRNAAARGGIVGCEIRYLEAIGEHCGDDRWYLDPARSGGGCLADNGPNAFDVASLLLGRVDVTSAELTRDARGVDMRAHVALVSERGAKVHVELDWAYPGECKQVVVETRQPPHMAEPARAPIRRVRVHRGVLQPPPPPLRPRHGLPG